MKSQITKAVSSSVVVWPQDLKFFDGFLKKNFKKVEYEAMCEDDTKLKARSLKDLLDYENPDFKRLASITIKASNGKVSGDSVEIAIGKPGFFSSHTGIISLVFKDVTRQNPIEEEVLKRIRAMRPWYFLLTRIPFKFVMPLLLFGYSLTLNAISLIKKIAGSLPLKPPSPSRFTEGEELVLTAIVLGILFLIGYAIDLSRNFLFPRYFFCIGRQEKAFKKRRNIAYIIFGVIILGILINIASMIIGRLFAK